MTTSRRSVQHIQSTQNRRVLVELYGTDSWSEPKLTMTSKDHDPLPNPYDVIARLENQRGDEECSKLAMQVKSRWKFPADYIAAQEAISLRIPDPDNLYVLSTVYEDKTKAMFELLDREVYDYDIDPICRIYLRRLVKVNHVELSVSTPLKPRQRSPRPEERKLFFDSDSGAKSKVWQSLHKKINDEMIATFRHTMDNHRVFVERLIRALEAVSLTQSSPWLVTTGHDRHWKFLHSRPASTARVGKKC